jgi:hypothetical protein
MLSHIQTQTIAKVMQKSKIDTLSSRRQQSSSGAHTSIINLDSDDENNNNGKLSDDTCIVGDHINEAEDDEVIDQFDSDRERRRVMQHGGEALFCGDIIESSSLLLCRAHHRIDPLRRRQFKRISEQAWKLLVLDNQMAPQPHVGDQYSDDIGAKLTDAQSANGNHLLFISVVFWSCLSLQCTR